MKKLFSTCPLFLAIAIFSGCSEEKTQWPERGSLPPTDARTYPEDIANSPLVLHIDVFVPEDCVWQDFTDKLLAEVILLSQRDKVSIRCRHIEDKFLKAHRIVRLLFGLELTEGVSIQNPTDWTTVLIDGQKHESGPYINHIGFRGDLKPSTLQKEEKLEKTKSM